MNNLSKWKLFIAEIPYMDLIMAFPMLSSIILYVIPLRLYALLGWLGLQFTIFIYILKKYNKVQRLLKNGKVIQTKILEIVKSPFTLSRNFDVIIRSSYFDGNRGRQYIFERVIHEQRGIVDVERDDEILSELKTVETLVNLEKADEYIVLIDDYFLFGFKGHIFNLIIIIFIWLVYLVFLIRWFL